jgi:hypothetical protein
MLAAKWNPGGTKLLTMGSVAGDFSVNGNEIVGMGHGYMARITYRKSSCRTNI